MSSPPPTTAPSPTRPGVITFIGWLLLIKSAIAAVAAIFAFVGIFVDNSGLEDSQLLTTGITEAIVAVVLLIAAQNLMAGSKGARTFVGVVVGIRLVATAVVILSTHSSGYLALSLFGATIGILALWALYAHDDSVAYFEAHG